MKIKKIFQKITLIFTFILSSISLVSCTNNNATKSINLDAKYIIENIETDLIFNFAEEKFGKFEELEKIFVNKNQNNIKNFLKKHIFYKNDFHNIEIFYTKTKENICKKLYEEIKNEIFQDEYLFNEKKFVQKLINDGFNIEDSEEDNKKIMINFKPKHVEWEDFIENFLNNFYKKYNDYITKKIIPEIYCNYMINDFFKENKKNDFGTTIQAYKINVLSIPKKNNGDYTQDFIELFIDSYIEGRKNNDLSEINNFVTGLKNKNAYEKINDINKLFKKNFKQKKYQLITNEDGQIKTNAKDINFFELTLIDQLNNYIKNNYTEKMREKKFRILEERKIRTKNFVKSGWYIKDSLMFGSEINNILKNEFSDKNFEAFKNKKSNEHIECINKKCFFKKNNIINNTDVIFYDQNNYYVVEIEDLISMNSTEENIVEISEHIWKNDYEKYKKETLKSLLKKQKKILSIKNPEICIFFKNQYKDLLDKKIIKCVHK